MKSYMLLLAGIAIFLVACKNKSSVEPVLDPVVDQSALIQEMVNAVNANDARMIEGLRDKVKKEHIDALLPLWDIEHSWKTKDGFTFLMCDQNDPRLQFMMQEALNSPSEDSQAYGLCYLQGKDCNFNSLLDQSGFFNKKEIERQIKALKK